MSEKSTKTIDTKNEEEKYTKEQILRSKKYLEYNDLLKSLLKEDKSYSIREIDNKINEFLKRKV